MHSLRQSAALLVLATPVLCVAQGRPSQEENTWTTPEPSKAPQAPTDPYDSPEVAPATPELSDPWSAHHPRQDEFPIQPPAESSERYEAERNEPWNDHESSASRPWSSPDEEPNRKFGQRLVPNYSLWLGAGAGWTFPFGDLWGTCRNFGSFGQCATVTGVPTHEYVTSGPALELDVGARLAHHYNVYGLWEHSWLGAGNATLAASGQPEHGDSDFVALGLRVSTDPEQLGFVLDLAVGTRRMRAHWADGTELQFADAPLESRLGIGADIRVNEHWSIAPLLYLGVGSFGKVQWVNSDRTVQAATQPGDVALSHGWVGIQMAAHVDAFGTK